MSATSHHGVPTIWSKGSNGIHEEKYASDSSSDEEPQVRMRVGEMYQAKVPQWQEGTSTGDKKSHSKEGMLIWTPNENLTDEKLDAYCQVAKEKHSYNVEQALGMLFWHKHDVVKSLHDMSNFTPMPDDWSMEDKVLFEQAYAFHGKNFRKIQQLIPDKEVGQLVKHYYTWKKSRMKTSLMDRQAAKSQQERYSDDSPVEEDRHVMDVDVQQLPQVKQTQEGTSKHKLPKGIHLNMDDITAMAGHPKGAEGYLDSLDEKLVELKKQVQIDKQECGKLTDDMGALPLPAQETAQPCDASWSDEELQLVKRGVEAYGEDCDVLAEVFASKSPAQFKELLETRREELKIDEILERRKKEQD